MNDRTKIAADLRHSADYPRDWMLKASAKFGIDHCALYEIMHTTGCFDNHSSCNMPKLFHRLADLIDPTCYNFGGEDGTNGENYDFACSACGRRGDVSEPNYCPNCGARVTFDDSGEDNNSER